MGQGRLGQVALLCTERAYVSKADTGKVIDELISRKDREKFFS